LQPEDWTYVGIEADDQLYVHAGLPFGISQAPEAFTRIVSCMYEVLRSLGWPLTFVIDDPALGGGRFDQVVFKILVFTTLLTLRGWIFGRDKNTFWPTEMARFLGFGFDCRARRLIIPPDKLTRFLVQIRELEELRKGSVHKGRAQLAKIEALTSSLSGTLASCMPALPFAPLLGRALRLEVHQNTLTLLSQSFLAFWNQHIEGMNGRPWRAPTAIFYAITVDTSESGFGATILDSEWKFAQSFNQDELLRMQSGSFSSTERELCGYLAALRELLRVNPMPTKELSL
jgi:hypothetical protein